MTLKSRPTKYLRALQREWYARLRETGFVDAEEMLSNGEMVLLQNAHHSVAYEHHDRRTAREEYYRMLSALVAAEPFDSEIDRIIMVMAADGARQRAIEVELNAMGIRRPPRFRADERRCRESIRLTIRKYERRWGLRKDRRNAA